MQKANSVSGKVFQEEMETPYKVLQNVEINLSRTLRKVRVVHVKERLIQTGIDIDDGY